MCRFQIFKLIMKPSISIPYLKWLSQQSYWGILNSVCSLTIAMTNDENVYWTVTRIELWWTVTEFTFIYLKSHGGIKNNSTAAVINPKPPLNVSAFMYKTWRPLATICTILNKGRSSNSTIACHCYSYCSGTVKLITVNLWSGNKYIIQGKIIILTTSIGFQLGFWFRLIWPSAR